MFSFLPDTPYFRSLESVVYDDLHDVVFNTEVFKKSDQVDFTTSSRLRHWRIQVREKVFYVSLSEIEKTSLALVQLLAKETPLDCSPSDFEILLRHICPSISGIYSEEIKVTTIRALLSLSIKWNIESIIGEIQVFLNGVEVKKMSLEQIVEVYNVLEASDVDKERTSSDGQVLYPMRSCLLKTILEYENQRVVVAFMLNGSSFPCYPLLRMKDLAHSTKFVNGINVSKCHCSSQNFQGKRLFERMTNKPPSSNCGLFCVSCNVGCCSTCQKKLCLMKINQLVDQFEYKESQKNKPAKLVEDILYYSPPKSFSPTIYPPKNWCSYDQRTTTLQSPTIGPSQQHSFYAIQNYAPGYSIPRSYQHSPFYSSCIPYSNYVVPTVSHSYSQYIRYPFI